MSRTKTLLVVFGSLFGLLALGLMVAAGVLMWTSGTERNEDGFLTSSTVELSTDHYALTSEQLDLGALRNDWLPAAWLATVQVNALPLDGGPVFVGIAANDDISGYLEDVAYTEVVWNSENDPDYRPRAGSRAPGVPSEQDFWVASAEGIGAQDVHWDIEPGRWTVVIMNSDAEPGVHVDVAAGVRTPWLMVLAVGLLIGGLLCLAVGAVMVALGLRRPRTNPGIDPQPSIEPAVPTGTQDRP
jgi:hypothetical protein